MSRSNKQQSGTSPAPTFQSDCRVPGLAALLALMLVTIRPTCGQQAETDPARPSFALELPSAPEFFRAASREAKPRWRQLYRATPKLPHRERNHSAFLLGTLLCETLVATEARDAQYVRNSTQDIRDCLTLLGLAEALDQRLPAIHEFAAGQNWPALRFEIEALEADFHRLLEKQMDARLGPLIALGRQLRCLDVCASIALESGQPVGIADPDYYAALAEQLDALSLGKQAPAFADELARELKELQRRWTGVAAGDELSERITATAEKVRGFLDRIMEAGR